MIRSNHEKASGGPFFRSLLTRAGATGEDLYDIYYYNMGSTDPMRFGLQGPSIVAFTDGGAPNSNLFARNADWTWVDGLAVSSCRSAHLTVETPLLTLFYSWMDGPSGVTVAMLPASESPT